MTRCTIIKTIANSGDYFLSEASTIAYIRSLFGAGSYSPHLAMATNFIFFSRYPWTYEG